jgi:hypothetical protein
MTIQNIFKWGVVVPFGLYGATTGGDFNVTFMNGIEHPGVLNTNLLNRVYLILSDHARLLENENRGRAGAEINPSFNASLITNSSCPPKEYEDQVNKIMINGSPVLNKEEIDIAVSTAKISYPLIFGSLDLVSELFYRIGFQHLFLKPRILSVDFRVLTTTFVRLAPKILLEYIASINPETKPASINNTFTQLVFSETTPSDSYEPHASSTLMLTTKDVCLGYFKEYFGIAVSIPVATVGTILSYLPYIMHKC